MQGYSSWVIEFQGRHYAIPPNGLRIGRGQDNEIVLPDDQASRRHATIWVAQGNVYIRDEGSTNGTFVRGQRVAAPMILRAGDQVQIGRAILRAQISGGPSAPAGAQPIYHGSPNQTWIIVTGVIFLCAFVATGIALVSALRPSAPSNIAFGTPSPIQAYTTVTSPNAVSRTPSTKDPIRTALMASVLIIVQLGTTDNVMFGSGSIIDPRGLILTNYHVVRDPNTRQPYNNRELIVVAINSTPERAPDRLFLAAILQADVNLDLAILKLTARADGKPLPADLGLSVIALGNSDTVQIGDRIQLIGFPEIGGNTVTMNEGIISGFLLDRAWMKTGGQVNPGNSGGMAINAAGELIGIPTIKVSDPRLGGQIGLLRPINLAKPLIDKAK